MHSENRRHSKNSKKADNNINKRRKGKMKKLGHSTDGAYFFLVYLDDGQVGVAAALELSNRQLG